MKFRCVKCNYVFEKERQVASKVCPNCGEFRTISKEKSAEDIVEESNVD